MKRTLIVPVLLVCVLTFLPGAAVSAAEGLSDAARAQIQALQDEKAARSSVQARIDSRLIYALREGRNQAIGGVPMLQSGVQADGAGRVLVDISATVTPALLNAIPALGGQVVSSVAQFRSVRALIPLSQVEALAARAEVQVVKPAVRAITNTGSVNSEGDITHRAALARQVFGVTGAGVKVGVLSDSVDYLLNSQATGDLPNDLVVLPGQSGVPASGEGTAMLEIVHDLAPGSQLYFASAFNGAAQFAQNILDLRAAGCDVIVDDVFYFNESPFQDGIIAQAVNAVTANGALYFSSAGNSGNLKQGTSGTWEGDFVDGGAITITGGAAKSGRIHSFGPALFDTATAFGFATTLFWSDPLGASTNDYDLYVLDATGNNIIGASTTVQNGSQDPYEIVNPPGPGQRLVIVKYSGEARFLHMDTIRGGLAIATGGNIKGHSAATNALSVAAIDVATVFPGPFVAGPTVTVESFSSDGPRRTFYHASGQPITPGNFLSTGGSVRNKPDITAADGVVTTLPPTSGLNPFFGTSAAAPHAGAIAALIKSYNPTLNSAQVLNILTNTALDIEDPGYDINAGIGVVMAYQSILATPPPSLTFVSKTLIDGNGNGVIDPNECEDLHVVLRNDTQTNFIAGLLLLYTTTPGVAIDQPVVAFPTLAQGQSFTNSLPFKFTVAPDFSCGTFVDFGLVISNQNRLRTNLFQLPSGLVVLNPALVNNSGPVVIPDGNTNGVDSTIAVSGVSGAVGKVTVALHVTHPVASELILQLIGPDGTTVNLARNRGFFGANYGANCTPLALRTTFDDNAPGSIALSTSPFLGAFRPEESLTAFAGKVGAALNGTWRLRAIDPATGNAGAIQCWTLALYPSVCTDGGGPCVSDVAVRATATPVPAVAGYDLTYQIAVTNSRPIVAAGVVLTNAVPTNATFVSATSAQAACTITNGIVTCAFGNLPSGSNAAATIVVRPNAVGTINSAFAVGALTADSNPSNNVATLTSPVITAGPAFVAAGVQLVAEGNVPASGGIESGEAVTVNLALRNVGQVASGNLVATLLEGSGVLAPSGPRTYGAIAPAGVGVQPFSFTASGVPGTSVAAVLQLQDGIQNLGTVTFHFTVGGDVTFENTASIVINQFGPATPYPSVINVSGVVGAVAGVRATFTKLSHTFPDDIDALLVGPLGQKLVLMSDAGGNVAVTNRTITFDDAAAGTLPNESGIVAGSFRPSNFDSGTEPGGDIFPAPAPGGAAGAALSIFAGTDPNGPWSLFIHDDGGGDAGTVASGWSLTLNAIYPVNPLADLAVTAAMTPSAPFQNEQFTLTLTVTNRGPSNAPSVVLTDVLPNGCTFGSASASQGGGVNVANGVVTADLGAISPGASATVTVQLTPFAVIPMTNTATVSGAVTDLSPANDTAITVFTPLYPISDVAVAVTAAPQPVYLSSNVIFSVLVTNRGPNQALNVTAAVSMASVCSVVGAVSTQGGCSFDGASAICNLAALPANGSALVTITAAATSVGSAAASFTVGSNPIDPAPANNTTNVLCTVIPTSPLIVPAGVAIVSEGFAPANGSIESGELVSLNFALRNAGNADTANLVATLLPTGGVTGPSPAQNYGSVAAGGPAASRSYSFTAAGTPGSTLTATFQLEDNGQNLGTATFSFVLSSSRTFTNSSVIIIPNQGQATNYPSTINVSGISGPASKVTVTIRQLTHTFPEDIDMLLVSPTGQKVLLMSDAGAGNAVGGVTLTLDDAAGALPFSSGISSGTYHGTDYPPGDTFPAPAPAGPYGTNLSVFNGLNPNGTWSLFVFDDAAGDAGRIDGGWTLSIQTATPVVSSADIAVSAAVPATVESGAPFSYVFTVANHGPAIATGVALNETLPAGFALSGVSVSQGSYSTGAGTVTANLGSLTVGATATVTVSGSAVGSIPLTNTVFVGAAQTDPNLANNTVAPVTVVNAPLLAIRRSGANIIISWPASAVGYVLQSATDITGPFANAGLTAINVNGTNEVTVPADGSAFYRLFRP